jgi:HSP20 family protein
MRTQSVLFPNFLFDAVESSPRADRTHSYVDENKDGYFIQLDAPGVKKEDVKISAEQRHLVIEAERKGRRAGKLRRVFSLPDDVNADGIQAQMQDGVLEVSLPKKEQAKPKQIVVGEAKESFFSRLEEKA